MIRRLFLLAVLSVTTAIFVGVPAIAQTNAPVRIGAFLPITGPGAFLGAPALATLQLYIDAQNKSGRPIKFTFYDTGLSAERAQTAVRRLIEKDKVHVIIGGPTTGASLAVIPIVAERRVPFISLASNSNVLKGSPKWVFKPTPSNDQACAQISDDIKKRKLRAVVILADAGGFGKSLASKCQGNFDIAGLALRAQQVITGDDAEQAKNLENLKPKLKGAALVVVGLGKDAARIAILRRHLKLKVPMYVLPAAVRDGYLTRAKDAAASTRAPLPPLSVTAPHPPGDARGHLLADFRSRYRKRWEVLPPGHAGYAYDALHLILGAIAGRGKVQSATIRTAIENSKNFVGLGGTYHLGPNDHFGLPSDALIMAEVRAGRWQRVD